MKKILILSMLTLGMNASNKPSCNELRAQADALFEQEKFDQSIDYYKQVLAQRFDSAAAFRMGYALHRCQQTWQAIDIYTMLHKKFPSVAEITYNLAYMSRATNQPAQAIPYYVEAIQQNPTNEDAYFGLAKAYLACGDFEKGLPLMEWRYKNAAKQQKESTHQFLKPTDMQGKRVFVRAEAWGLGDYLHFIRYARCLKEQGAYVIAQTLNPLKPIISLCPYIDAVITQDDPFPTCDIQIPLLSLPLIFKTTLETIPNNVPYLYAEKKLVESWRTKLATDQSPLKIGIYWDGHAYFESFTFPWAKKTIPLTMLMPLLRMPQVSFYSLQALSGSDQLKQLPSDITVHHYNDLDTKNGRFMDSAALIKNLDLIITVDTSIAHLAGGLGVPVWVLLPYTAEWRWMLNRNDSPWYPTMRLFRQTKPGDWSTVVEAINDALATLIKDNRSKQ